MFVSVLLSGLADDQLSRLYPLDKEIKGAPALCLAKTGQQLLDQIHIVKKNGYATVIEEYEPGLVGASVPIKDFSGSIVAALNVAAPKARFEAHLKPAALEMKKAAARITLALSPEYELAKGRTS